MKFKITVDMAWQVDILKPVWFLAFQKPNPGCSYPRTGKCRGLYPGKIVFGFFRKTILRWVYINRIPEKLF